MSFQLLLDPEGLQGEWLTGEGGAYACGRGLYMEEGLADRGVTYRWGGANRQRRGLQTEGGA